MILLENLAKTSDVIYTSYQNRSFWDVKIVLKYNIDWFLSIVTNTSSKIIQSLHFIN